MTATTTPAPQVTFPGQAAAPPGPCDLMPMYLMHHAFRRDLAAFAAAGQVLLSGLFPLAKGIRLLGLGLHNLGEADSEHSLQLGLAI